MLVRVLLEFDFAFVLVSVGVNACIQHFDHFNCGVCSRPEHDHSVMAGCLMISAGSGCPVTYVMLGSTTTNNIIRHKIFRLDIKFRFCSLLSVSFHLHSGKESGLTRYVLGLRLTNLKNVTNSSSSFGRLKKKIREGTRLQRFWRNCEHPNSYVKMSKIPSDITMMYHFSFILAGNQGHFYQARRRIWQQLYM